MKNTKTKKQKPSTVSPPPSHPPFSTLPATLLQYKSNKKIQKNKQKNNLITLVSSAVFVQPNFLSQEECNSWIHHAEQNIGFEYMCSPQTKEYAQRECGRIQINDWTMAERLYEKMKPIVEEIAKQVIVSYDVMYQPVCCNGNIRIYKYEKNMSFGRHYDGSNLINRYEQGKTEMTVLIYLSSCEGGATRFYLPTTSGNGNNRKLNKKQKILQGGGVDDDKEGIAFFPLAGAILLHMHGDRCLEHEADPVVKGIKYVLRTDIVYAKLI